METTNFLDLAGFIDHTLLKPEATEGQIRTLCNEALQYGFKGVCVNSTHLDLAHSLLHGSNTLLVSVLGFPLGACLSTVKKAEAEMAFELGAQELDMVINIGAIKDGAWAKAEEDIRLVTNAVPIPVKVILETGLLTHDEIVTSSKISESAGARFVKTCTGFAVGGASVEHIRLMRQSVSSKMQVKASGGIKTYAQAKALIEAGANRLGTSSGVQLITGQSVAPQEY